MPMTDIIQMIGRAGRPQYDTSAIACIFTVNDKKEFIKRFLFEKFPVESSLHKQMSVHLNAEIQSGSLTNITECFD